jgi:hypothetical protein
MFEILIGIIIGISAIELSDSSWFKNLFKTEEKVIVQAVDSTLKTEVEVVKEKVSKEL